MAPGWPDQCRQAQKEVEEITRLLDELLSQPTIGTQQELWDQLMALVLTRAERRAA